MTAEMTSLAHHATENRSVAEFTEQAYFKLCHVRDYGSCIAPYQ